MTVALVTHTIKVAFRAALDFTRSGWHHAGEYGNSILDDFNIKTTWTKLN